MNTNVIEPMTAKGMGTETQEGDITMNKVYTFRTLNSTDMFLMFKILGKIGINEFNVKELIASATNGEAKGDATTMMGISVILEMGNIILGNISKCETEIYQLLSNTSNLSVEDVRELDIATFAEMVIDFIKKEEFKDFLKVVLKSFKPGI